MIRITRIVSKIDGDIQLIFIISMIILFSVLLIIAYILPNSRIQHHIKESKDYYPLVETQSIYKDLNSLKFE